MKRLKFSDALSTLILNGKKDTTWRINDEKNIKPKDSLLLCNIKGEGFAKAEVVWVKETEFENLSYEDKEGHEKFMDEKEMHETYSRYYSVKVTPKTKVKVIKFKLCN